MNQPADTATIVADTITSISSFRTRDGLPVSSAFLRVRRCDELGEPLGQPLWLVSDHEGFLQLSDEDRVRGLCAHTNSTASQKLHGLECEGEDGALLPDETFEALLELEARNPLLGEESKRLTWSADSSEYYLIEADWGIPYVLAPYRHVLEGKASVERNRIFPFGLSGSQVGGEPVELKVESGLVCQFGQRHYGVQVTRYALPGSGVFEEVEWPSRKPYSEGPQGVSAVLPHAGAFAHPYGFFFLHRFFLQCRAAHTAIEVELLQAQAPALQRLSYLLDLRSSLLAAKRGSSASEARDAIARCDRVILKVYELLDELATLCATHHGVEGLVESWTSDELGDYLERVGEPLVEYWGHSLLLLLGCWVLRFSPAQARVHRDALGEFSDERCYETRWALGAGVEGHADDPLLVDVNMRTNGLAQGFNPRRPAFYFRRSVSATTHVGRMLLATSMERLVRGNPAWTNQVRQVAWVAAADPAQVNRLYELVAEGASAEELAAQQARILESQAPRPIVHGAGILLGLLALAGAVRDRDKGPPLPQFLGTLGEVFALAADVSALTGGRVGAVAYSKAFAALGLAFALSSKVTSALEVRERDQEKSDALMVGAAGDALLLAALFVPPPAGVGLTALGLLGSLLGMTLHDTIAKDELRNYQQGVLAAIEERPRSSFPHYHDVYKTWSDRLRKANFAQLQGLVLDQDTWRGLPRVFWKRVREEGVLRWEPEEVEVTGVRRSGRTLEFDLVGPPPEALYLCLFDWDARGQDEFGDGDDLLALGRGKTVHELAVEVSEEPYRASLPRWLAEADAAEDPSGGAPGLSDEDRRRFAEEQAALGAGVRASAVRARFEIPTGLQDSADEGKEEDSALELYCKLYRTRAAAEANHDAFYESPYLLDYHATPQILSGAWEGKTYRFEVQGFPGSLRVPVELYLHPEPSLLEVSRSPALQSLFWEHHFAVIEDAAEGGRGRGSFALPEVPADYAEGEHRVLAMFRYPSSDSDDGVIHTALWEPKRGGGE